jgi:hypothetical protein
MPNWQIGGSGAKNEAYLPARASFTKRIASDSEISLPSMTPAEPGESSRRGYFACLVWLAGMPKKREYSRQFGSHLGNPC